MKIEARQPSVMSTDKSVMLVLLLAAFASPAWGNSVGVQNEGVPLARPGQTTSFAFTRCSSPRGAAIRCSLYAGSLFLGTFSQAVTRKAGRGPQHRGGAYYGLPVNASGIDAAFSHPLNMTRFAMSDEHASAVDLSSGPGAIAVPEPGSLGLLATGLVGVAFVLRRRM
jgi:PEP-CTERM motif